MFECCCAHSATLLLSDLMREHKGEGHYYESLVKCGLHFFLLKFINKGVGVIIERVLCVIQ